MSDTFYIPRYKERRNKVIATSISPEQSVSRSMGIPTEYLDDLAQHLEQEHERNNQLEEKLNALISIVRQASFPPGVFDKVHKLFESSRNEFFKSVKEEGDLPKGENN